MPLTKTLRILWFQIWISKHAKAVFQIFIARPHTDARDIDIANLSVCPSVRNVPVSDENGLPYRHSFFHHTVAKSF